MQGNLKNPGSDILTSGKNGSPRGGTYLRRKFVPGVVGFGGVENFAQADDNIASDPNGSRNVADDPAHAGTLETV